MRSRISCNRSRARSAFRSRPTNSSRTALRRQRHGPWKRRGTARQSGRAADRAVSRHAGGRARRRKQHACCLWPRPCGFHRISPAPSGSVARAGTDDLRAYLGELARRGLRPRPWRGGCRRSGSFTAFSMRKGCAKTIRPRCLKDRSAPPAAQNPDASPRSTACCARRARPIRRRRCATRLRAARLACLVELLYATGLRVSELVALPVSAARRDARVIVVRGKGNKERMVPLNDAAKRAMAAYLACSAQAGPRRRIEMAVPVVRRERPSHAASISLASSRRSPPRRDCAASR